MKLLMSPKKQYATLAFLMIISLICPAENKGSANNTNQANCLKVPEKWMEAVNSRHHYSFGIDRENHWDGMLGLEAMYDVRIHPNFTIGVYGGVAFKNADWHNTTEVLTGFRTSYFPWGLGQYKMSRLEPYICLTGGLNIDEARHDFYELEASLHAGARYRIAKNWSLYAEAGTGLACGLTFMMR